MIDPVSSVAFEAEAADKSLMQRPPRDPKAPLFSTWLLGWSLLQGAAVLLVVMVVFAVALRWGLPSEKARTLSFVTLVIANFALIFTNRSQTETPLALLLRTNRTLWAILLGTVAVLALVVYLPGLRRMFSFGPLHKDDLAVCLLAGVGTFIAMAIVKRAMVKEWRT